MSPIRVHQSTGLDATQAEARAIVPANVLFGPNSDLSAYGLPFLALVEPPEAPSPHAQVVRAPNEQINGVWTQAWAFDPPNEADWLQAAKTAARAQVDAKEAKKRASFPWDFGAPHGVLHLQIRGTEDQANWLTLQNTASAYIAMGYGDDAVLGLRTEENVTVPVTANQVMPILLAMAGFGGNTKARAWAIKDAINAATTEAGVAAVLAAELDTGWPIDSL